MQPRFTVGILVLKAEGLVSTVRYSGFLFQTAPTSVVAKPGCRLYQSFHAGCRLGRSGSSCFPVCFRLQHWCGCGPAPKVRICRDRRRRYRYICRPVGLPARGGAVPDEVGSFRFGTCPGKFVLAFFGKASAERVVGVVDGATIRLPLI